MIVQTNLDSTPIARLEHHSDLIERGKKEGGGGGIRFLRMSVKRTKNVENEITQKVSAIETVYVT